MRPALLPPEKLLRKTTPLSRLGASVKSVIAGAPKIQSPFLNPPKTRPSLSQGMTNACVGFSLSNWLNTSFPAPWYNVDSQFAVSLWEWAQAHDGDPSTVPGDPNSGTNLWTGATGLRVQGYITGSDAWGIQTERDLRHYILTQGPTVLGIPWYDGFDIPQAGPRLNHGLITLSGNVVGAHAILCYWFSQETNRYWLLNSWGGYAPYDKFNQVVEISAGDMRKLMNRGGQGLKMYKSVTRVK